MRLPRLSTGGYPGKLGRSGAVSILPIFILLIAFACTPADAQWPDCNFHCTAKDVVVQEAWLGDATGKKLPSCAPGSPVNALIWVKFYNNANSERYGVLMLADIYIDGTLAYSLYDTGLCVLDAIPAKRTTSVPIYSFSWTCGQEVRLSRFVLSWETSKGTTCSSADRSCGVRGAKCYGGFDAQVSVERPLAAEIIMPGPQCCCQDLAFAGRKYGGTPPYNYRWSFGDGTDRVEPAPVHRYQGPGDYSVELKVTDSAGNVASAASTAEVYPAPSANFVSTSPSCDGMVHFEDRTSGGSPPNAYLWEFGDGSPLYDAQSPSHLYAKPGTYTVNLTVTDSKGCTGKASQKAVVHPRPLASAGIDKSVSPGGKVIIGDVPAASLGTPPYTYSWSPIQGLDNPASPNPSATPEKSTTYKLTVTDSNGCTATDSATAYLSAINITKYADNSTVRAGELIVYHYRVTNPGDSHLKDVVVSDSAFGIVSGPIEGDDDGDGMLDPGDIWIYEANANLLVNTTNVAIVYSTDPVDREVVSESNLVKVEVIPYQVVVPYCLILGPEDTCEKKTVVYTALVGQEDPYQYTLTWKVDGLEVPGTPGENTLKIEDWGTFGLGQHVIQLEVSLADHAGTVVGKSTCELEVGVTLPPKATILVMG